MTDPVQLFRDPDDALVTTAALALAERLMMTERNARRLPDAVRAAFRALADEIARRERA